ncbi:MAG: hypothetical protein WDN49_09455 [Acetobacteraceae bacterium]
MLKGDQTGSETRCALSGKIAELHTGNFPQPNLPGLGQTYIFSRNRDIPSLTRYGRTADASFPIDSELVRRLSSAITELTREDAKGRTWRLIPAETGDKPDLFIVSLPPDVAAGGANAFVDDDDSEETLSGKPRLLELASRVIEHSEGHDSHGHAQAAMSVLVLRTVDPANRKAIYHRPVRADELFDAATRWDKAAANTPPSVKFHIWQKGKGAGAKLVRSGPPRVSPLSITDLSREQFVDGGRRRVSLIGIPFAEAFSLFLHEGNFERRALSMLRVLLQRHTALLLALSQLARRGRSNQGKLYLEDFDPKADLRLDALRSTAWIGALLYHLNRPKEVYMSSAGYRLGQILAAADVVHIGYCADERGGQIPMTLIGNAVFAIAGSNPQRALAILQERWKPYDAWAKDRPELREKIDEIFGESGRLKKNARALRGSGKPEEAAKEEKKIAQTEAPGWAMLNGLSQARRLRELCSGLSGVFDHADATDALKAELLLGYMAGLPAERKPDDPQKADGPVTPAQDDNSNDEDEGDNSERLIQQGHGTARHRCHQFQSQWRP